MSDSASVRNTAIESLKNRETRDYVGQLIDMVQSPVEYKIQPVQGPGSQGGLLIDSPRFTMLRTYNAPPAFNLASTFRGTVTYDNDGMPIVIRGVELDRMKFMNDKNQWAILAEAKARSQELITEANIKAAAAQQQIIADVSAIEQFNNQAAEVNARILPALTQAAGAPESTFDQDGLYTWWYDRLGYRYEPPEKVQAAVNAFPQAAPYSLTTCFAAGTAVHTIEGSRPIEKGSARRSGFEPGRCDRPARILPDRDGASQCAESNAPSHVERRRNPAGKRLSPLLAAGAGWSQARDLKPGDVLRTLGRTIRVVSVEPGEVEPLFNLDVARNRSFFVGNGSVLVHDNTLPPVGLLRLTHRPILTSCRMAVLDGHSRRKLARRARLVHRRQIPVNRQVVEDASRQAPGQGCDQRNPEVAAVRLKARRSQPRRAEAIRGLRSRS